MKRIIVPAVSDSRYLLMEVFSLVGGNWEEKEKHEPDGRPTPPCWISKLDDSRYSWPDTEDPLVIIDTNRISIANYNVDEDGNIIPTHSERTIIRFNSKDLEFLETRCNLNHAIAYSFRNYFTSIDHIKTYDDSIIEYTTVPYIKHEFGKQEAD